MYACLRVCVCVCGIWDYQRGWTVSAFSFSFSFFCPNNGLQAALLEVTSTYQGETTSKEKKTKQTKKKDKEKEKERIRQKKRKEKRRTTEEKMIQKKERKSKHQPSAGSSWNLIFLRLLGLSTSCVAYRQKNRKIMAHWLAAFAITFGAPPLL